MSTIEAITMPKWGMTMTEGTITSWLVAEGDVIERGQEIVEIETTKLSNVVEAAAEGVLRRIVLPEGATAPVGALAAVIADESASDEEIAAFIASYADRQGDGQSGPNECVASKILEVPGGQINLVEAGAEDGDAIVLLHGFGGDLKTWMFNQSGLAAAGRVIAIDLPGHGGSSTMAEDDPVSETILRVEAALDAVAPGELHLVGHSFGGGIAALLAGRRPDRVSSLSLIAPIGLGKTMNRGFLVDFVAAERRRPLQNVLERLFADPSKITGDMVEETLKSKRLEGVPECLSQLADAIADETGQRISIGDTLANLACPVLLIWGEHDQIVPVPQAGDLPANVRLQTIANTGHMPQMEAAAVVNDAILDNIRRTK
jgi:pyruvate dehydrogenase E2 component (dihydrolipoamide acetyltransferase)